MKLIVISNSLADVQDVMEFAKEHGYGMVYYSREEWHDRESQYQQALKQSAGLEEANGKNEGEGEKVIPFYSSAAYSMEKIKEESIKHALRKYKGNTTRAAKSLKIGRATLYRKIKQMNINLKIIKNTDSILIDKSYIDKKAA